MDEIEGSQTDFSSVMTEFRTNRKTRKRFPVVGKVISREPSIVSFEDAGSIYVEDGSGHRYSVKCSDGHTVEVEFSDAFDSDSSEMSEQEVEQAEDVEAREPVQNYSVRVTWDGAIDFEESYNSADEDERLKLSKRLIKRYGKIAESYLGKSFEDVEDEMAERREERQDESLL